MQKRQPREKGFALIENDITTSGPAFGTAYTLQIHAIVLKAKTTKYGHKKNRAISDPVFKEKLKLTTYFKSVHSHNSGDYYHSNTIPLPVQDILHLHSHRIYNRLNLDPNQPQLYNLDQGQARIY